MKDKTAVPQKRRWLRRLGWSAGILVLLVVVLYFVVTSQAFFQGVILPKVGKSLHAEVTVGDAAISPFSSVVLHQVKVQTTGSEPLLTAAEVRLRYHLFQILGGNIHVEEISVISPAVNVVYNADGTSNLDPLMTKSSSSASAPSSGPAKSSSPPKLNLAQLVLSNATVRVTQKLAGGGSSVMEVTNVNVTLANLQNGQTGKLTIAANARIENTSAVPGAAGSLQAVVAGEYSISLTPELKPGSITGSTRLDVQKAGGAMGELAGLGATLSCDTTPTEVKQLAVRFQKGGADLGEVRVSGPFDVARSEGRLDLVIGPVDRRVLNLFGAASGTDFGATALSSTNRIELAKGGSIISLAGQFNALKFGLTKNKESTPALDLRSDYQLALNRADNTVLLQKLDLSGLQGQRPFLRAQLTSPMTLGLGGSSNAVGDAALKLTVTNLNFAEWKPLLGESTGTLDLTLDVLSGKSGQRLAVALNGRYGNYQFDHYAAALDFNIAANQGRWQILKSTGTLTEGGNAGGQFDVSGDYDPAKRTGQLNFKVANLNENGLRPFLNAPLGGKKLVSVMVNATASAQYTANGDAAVKSDFNLTNLVVVDPRDTVPGTPLAARFQVDASLHRQVAEVRQFLIALTPTDRATNQLALTGKVDMSQPGAITGGLKLASSGLDLTRYYDLIGGKGATNQKATAATAAVPAPAVAGEPAAVKLPFRNFGLDASIGHVYLHEIEIEKFQATAKLDGGHFLLKPFHFTMNGAPVDGTVDLNLGVPGYQYDLAFSADKIPIAPLANSLTVAYAGRAKGELTAHVQLKGEGITGASLKTNLSGQAGLVFTNANIDLGATMVTRVVVTAISVALGLPELTQSPINFVMADAKIGGGSVDLSRMQVVSSVLSASTSGSFTIADVLTNSTINNLPVAVGLPVSLAEKAHISSASGTNTGYVDLGKIATVGGVIRDPKTKIDYVAIGLLTGSKVLTRLPGAVGSGAGTVLKGIEDLGGVLTGKGSTNTNAPSTNKSLNPLDLFRKKGP